MEVKTFEEKYKAIVMSDVFYTRENCPIMNRKNKGKKTNANH